VETLDLIADYEDHLRGLNRSARTIEDYIGFLRRLDRDLPCGLLSAHTDELRDYINDPCRSAPATRSLNTNIVAGFCGWVTDPDRPVRLDFNAAADLPRVRVPQRRRRVIRNDWLADILHGAREPYRAWFTIAAYGGLRCCEISGLDRGHISDRQIWIRAGKGDKERIVPTHPKVLQAVEQLPPGPIAVDRDGRTRLTAKQVAHRGNHHLRGPLGFPGVSMHALRRWFGTNTYRATRDPRAVQELLGHSSLSTTQVYIDVAEEEKAAAVAGLPDVL
jgi:integrase/recombinase XerC